ncbi:MAG: discoidin domain-containing protein, partial [Bacteroidetes bacterium]|nr:discoidin domain-containing protein [Bacteroidota bacterium]
GESSPEYNKKLATGEPGGENWIPAEVNTTLLWPKAWYYHTGHQPRSVTNLMELYYTSVGRGSPLNLGLAIAPSGQIRDIDAQALLKFRKQVMREFENNLIENATVSASNYRGKSANYNAEKVSDKTAETYWATDDSIQRATLEIDFENETTFNRLLLQEYIALGQRIHNFTLEIETDSGWEKIARGTTIGYKRILKFDDVKASKARVTLETNTPCLTLSNLEIYNSPPLLLEPEILCDMNGTITLNAAKDLDIYYKVGNSSSEFEKYSSPISLQKGGTVQAFAKHKTSVDKSDVMTKEFGMAKSNWRILDVDSETKDNGSSKNAIDGNPATNWISNSKKANKSHFISINLGKQVSISGFSYLPCAKGCDGIIYEYEFYASIDGKNWGEPVSKGEFSNIQNNPVEQVVKFKKEVKAKYIKLVSKSTVKNSNITSVAEIAVFHEN